MKTERDVIQLAGSGLSAEQIAAKLKISSQAVIKIGRRTGIYLQTAKRKRTASQKTKRT
jgi:DNA-binding CsgD family transcriptional regulator